jgi:hypothetical protein
MKRLAALGLFLVLLATPLATLAATVTIIHSCDNYGEVVPCG